MTSPLSVCVFCASSDGADPSYLAAARAFGEFLAGRGHRLVYGAGKVGLMGALVDGVLSHGGDVLGVIPRDMVERGWCHPSLPAVDVTPSMNIRKEHMIEASDALVALPGGPGTLEELADALSWRRLGLHAKPVYVLNLGGFFDPLLTMLSRMYAEGFSPDAPDELLTVCPTLEALEAHLS